MAELEFSGASRYSVGLEYTKYLLHELSSKIDPAVVAIQVKNLQSLGTISDSVAEAFTNFLQGPKK